MSIRLQTSNPLEVGRRCLLAPEILPARMKGFDPDKGASGPFNFSESVLLSQGMVADLSFMVRALVGAVPSHVSNSPLFENHHFEPIFGITSGCGLFQGLIDWFRAKSAYRRADTLQDSKGKKSASFGLVKAGTNIGLGTSFLFKRFFTGLALVKNGPKAPLPKSVSICEQIATGFLIGISFLGTVGCALARAEQDSVLKALETSAHPSQWLARKLRPQVQDLKKMSKEERALLLREVLLFGAENLKKAFELARLKPLANDAQYKILLLKIYGKERLQLEALAYHNREMLVRVCGSDLVDKMETAMKTGKKTFPELVSKVKQVALRNYKMNSLGIAVGIATIILAALGVIFSGGIALMVVAFLFVAVEIVSFSLNAYAFHLSLGSNETLRADQQAFKTSMAICTMAFALVLTLTLLLPAGLFSTMPLILALIIAVGWFSINAIALKRSQDFERAELENKPTVFSFRRYLEIEESPRKIDAVFKKLCKENKKLRDTYAFNKRFYCTHKAMLDSIDVAIDQKILEKKLYSYQLQKALFYYVSKHLR